jgi:hypothetical protein
VHAKEALTAPPGARRDPLKLAGSAFDEETPTEDQKKKQRGRRARVPSQIPEDERIDASPSDVPPAETRATLPDTPRSKQPVSEAAIEISRRSSPPPRPRLGLRAGGPPVSSEDTARPRLPEAMFTDDYSTDDEALDDDFDEPSTIDVPGREALRPPDHEASTDREAHDGESDDDLSTVDSLSEDLFPVDAELLALAEGRIPERLAPEPDDELEDEPEEPKTREGDSLAETGEHPPDRTVPEDPLPHDGVEDLDAQVERLYQAERHFRRGDRALRRERFADAVAAFERAVELCPDEGEFLSHLGYARYQTGDDRTRAQAVEELRRGAELAPKLDITHLLRARVLADRGDTIGARDAFGQALTANPDCKEALEGLTAMKTR